MKRNNYRITSIFVFSVLIIIYLTACGSSGSGTSTFIGGEGGTSIFVETKKETDLNNDGTINQVVYYIYDADGSRTKWEWDYVNDGTINRVFYYTYDAHGNRIKEEKYWDNDGTIDNATYYTWDQIE
jgi:hypothetical protein